MSGALQQLPATDSQRVKPRSEKLVVQDDSPIAHLLDTGRFEHMQRIAMAMARASLIPDHLHGKGANPAAVYEQTAANCLLIVNQAIRWGVDPFAVAAETYVVHGKLGFQGKLVAAVINARAGLIGRLNYTFAGQGDDRTVTVSGQLEGEPEIRTVTLTVGQAKTDNDMWRKDPDQKLVYSGATRWARRHCPEVMLGVVTAEDLERMTITVPSQPASLGELTEKIQEPLRQDAPTSPQTASPEPPSNGSEPPETPYNPPTPEEQKAAEGSQVDPAVDAAEGVDVEAEPTSDSEEAALQSQILQAKTMPRARTSGLRKRPGNA